MNKRTLVLGASPNPTRVSNQAVGRLLHAGHEAIPVGIRNGEIAGQTILIGQPNLTAIHTVTLYMNPTRQEALYEYIIGLQPKRIIFNPGTENPALAKLAKENDIEVEVACTLVLLSLGEY